MIISKSKKEERTKREREEKQRNMKKRWNKKTKRRKETQFENSHESRRMISKLSFFFLKESVRERE